MRCSTCGETLRIGESRCPTCGSVAARRPVPAAPRDRELPQRGSVLKCTRCGYRGEGIPYFRKAGHVGLLAGLSILTYGIGGLVYYVARRGHEVCPACGVGWEHARAETAAALPETADRASETADASSPVPSLASSLATGGPVRLPPNGLGRRIVGSVLAVIATTLVTAGIAGAEFAPVFVGTIFGAAGSGTFYWGWKALQYRRQAVLRALNRKVLMLATQRDGVLTVTEVAAELNLSLPAAEKLMNGMDDGLRVRSDISKEGIIFYEFPEVRHQKALRAGTKE